VGSQKQGLYQGVLCFLQEQGVDAQNKKSKRSERVGWEFKVGLVFHHEPPKSPHAMGRFFSKNC